MFIQNEYFKLFVQNNDVVILPMKTGYLLKSFDLITRQYPRLKIDSFSGLRKALTQLGEEHIIGTWLPLVEATVSSNKLVLEVIINANMQEIEEDKTKLIEEVNRVLDQLGVVYGRQDLQDATIKPGAAIIGAEGKEPVKGADAVVTYIKQPPRKPVIREDGTANHYEMNFVFPIEENQWLGEKQLPQEGEDGVDIFGGVIPALKGNDVALQYDRKSVYEKEEDGKIVLYALHGGALEYTKGLVSVGKLLVITGDVGPETGSITFDGAVKIYGTVRAGYSVVATDDISIEAHEGITNAKLIQTSAGDIYIKGGVFGGGVTTIEAQGKIYLKHANNCKLYGSEIHVGLYLFGTDASANRVYVDRHKGRIIGGTVEALYTIECAVSGNLHERETILRAQGVDRKVLYKEVQEMAQELKESQELVGRLKVHLEKLAKSSSNLSRQQTDIHKKTVQTIEANEIEIIKLDKEIQTSIKRLQSSENVQIEVTKEAFPGTTLQVEKLSTILNRSAAGVFKVVDGVLNV